MSLTETSFTYIPGQLKVERIDGKRFRLEGNYAIGFCGTDHCQLIYEALEIAAQSSDRYKAVFAAFTKEYLDLTMDWDETDPPKTETER